MSIQHQQEAAQRAIEAGKVLLDRELVIKSDADFTPAGRRTAHTVSYSVRGRYTGQQIRWYVGRKVFRSLEYNNENVKLTREWVGIADYPVEPRRSRVKELISQEYEKQSADEYRKYVETATALGRQVKGTYLEWRLSRPAKNERLDYFIDFLPAIFKFTLTRNQELKAKAIASKLAESTEVDLGELVGELKKVHGLSKLANAFLRAPKYLGTLDLGWSEEDTQDAVDRFDADYIKQNEQILAEMDRIGLL